MFQWLRSFLFVVQMYAMMAIMGLLFLPLAIAGPKGASWSCKTYARYVLWTMRWMVGITPEVRGTVPQGEVMVAAKHQSFLDILMIFEALPQAKFIMKRELLYAPILGQYAKRLGCVPVDRGKKAAAVEQMLSDVQSGTAPPGQLVIYPQGTRVAPGAKVAYTPGTHALYSALSQSCTPTATNVGLFWPRKGIGRKPGRAVVEFLDPITPGLDRETFMGQLEQVIETNSKRLMAEAGYHEPD